MFLKTFVDGIKLTSIGHLINVVNEIFCLFSLLLDRLLTIILSVVASLLVIFVIVLVVVCVVIRRVTLLPVLFFE